MLTGLTDVFRLLHFLPVELSYFGCLIRIDIDGKKTLHFLCVLYKDSFRILGMHEVIWGLFLPDSLALYRWCHVHCPQQCLSSVHPRTGTSLTCWLWRKPELQASQPKSQPLCLLPGKRENKEERSKRQDKGEGQMEKGKGRRTKWEGISLVVNLLWRKGWLCHDDGLGPSFCLQLWLKHVSPQGLQVIPALDGSLSANS